MKAHTSGFKTNLIELGRELRGVITYNNTTLEDEIYSMTPHYEADILKSVMKQLDLELSVDIPLNTVINCQIGILVNGNYEMLNYGNYVVYNSEKQEDTGTYKITCYDKLLYSMKQNEDLGVTYPISIRDYLVALANKIGLTVATQTFYNSGLTIPSELYLGLDYTYRDILDEIAQATGSIIALNENDEIEVRYPIQTNDTIDEDYLKDVNVDFGQKYGPINSIVLSRAGESDNVYLRDEESVEEDGLTEIKIVDNQIMNFNNRSDYLQGILNALDGLYYYINDFNSTGILYYEVGDLYNVQIGENTYQCLMLNDEVKVTTGIEELVHTDMPEKSETDYSKADKTDRKINQTYLIVDKQNQKIESVVNSVTEQNNKISRMTQTVDKINSKISDIADITTYGESNQGYVELNDINQSEPIMIKVHPTSTNISYLYPNDDLYPSNLQYLPDRIIRFERTYQEEGETLTENIDYELPDDLLRYSSEIYDEFYLDYDSHTCQVTKRCEYYKKDNLFNPKSILQNEGTTNIRTIEVDNQQNFIITSASETNTIRVAQQHRLNATYPQYRLSFGNLTNINSDNIFTTVTYYDNSNSIVGTRNIQGNRLAISRTDFNNVSYFKLSFSFYNRVANETYSFNVMLNTGTSYKTYSQYGIGIRPLAEQIIDYPYPQILLGDGNYKISLAGYDYGYLYVRLMAKNIYTTQFAIKAEVTSEINQTAQQIDLNVNQKLTNYSTTTEMNSAITVKANEINSTVSQKVGKNEVISSINQSAEAVSINANKVNLSGKTIDLTGENIKIASTNFNVDKNGTMNCQNANVSGTINATAGTIGKFLLKQGRLTTDNDENGAHMTLDEHQIGFSKKSGSSIYSLGTIGVFENNTNINFIRADGNRSKLFVDEITAEVYNRSSLESLKTNIEQYRDNAIDLIKNNYVYRYNFKTEKDTTKKHIGFIIPDNGGNYKTPDEVIAQSGKGIDTYTMTSILWKAVQEQQEQIEQMKKEIEILKGGNK